MNIILLSGGSGQRLWPLSNSVRSKQFIKILKAPDGSYESMIQRVYRQINEAHENANVIVATSHSQISAVHNHLGSDVHISVEPCRRNTFPAIALAAAYLRDVCGVPEEESVVVCSVDSYVDTSFFHTFSRMAAQVESGEANLALMGIVPTYPSEKYGYILPLNQEAVSPISVFKEKPSEEKAREYMNQGGLWNAGVFAFKLRYVLDAAKEALHCGAYSELMDNYSSLPSISFDYAVSEKEPSIQVVRYRGQWLDIGTWNTLTDVMEEPTVGDVTLNEQCDNVYVVNELDMPVLGMNLKDLIISASHQGILVTEKHASAHIRPFVDAMTQEARFAEKSWGDFNVLDMGEMSLTVRIHIKPGGCFRYHSHEKRKETVTVVQGRGKALVDGRTVSLNAGDMVDFPIGCRHTIFAETAMTLIEVQVGEEIDAADKVKYDFPQK